MRTIDTIEQMPGVVGGFPVIAGTRIPVRTIVEMYTDTYPGDIDAILNDFPQLNRQQVEAALDYYATSPGIIDDDIARQRQAYIAHLRSE